jgi:hypothetical protein
MGTDHRSLPLWTLALSAFITAGCGRSPLVPKNPFPTREALAALAAAPPAATVAAPRRVTPSRWTVDASDLPEDAAPVEARFVTLAGKDGQVRFSRELRCIAREMARFHLEHGAEPDERLHRFILGACGSPSEQVSLWMTRNEVPEDVPDDALLASWTTPPVHAERLQGNLAGAWLERRGNQAVIFGATARDEGVTVSPPDENGRVIVRGSVPPASTLVLGLINHGEGRVARCDLDPTLPLPQFAASCPLAEGDASAWVQILSATEGRLLMTSAALVLARREDGPLEYTPSAREPRPVSSAADLQRAVLGTVNAIRAAEKLPPLALAPRQSAVNAKLAPHFFEAERTYNHDKSELVALGVMAGYEVGGTIQKGEFFAALLHGAADASRWLDYALDSPMGRHTLLDPQARALAVGPLPTRDAGGVGALVTSYAFFGSADHRADVTRVHARLARERRARGVPVHARVAASQAVRAEAARVHAGKREAMSGLEWALANESDRLGRPVRGWVVVTNDLDTMPLPAELFAPGPLKVTIEITHVLPEGAAWGSYVVYFLVAQPSPQRTAAAAPPVLHP